MEDKTPKASPLPAPIARDRNRDYRDRGIGDPPPPTTSNPTRPSLGPVPTFPSETEPPKAENDGNGSVQE